MRQAVSVSLAASCFALATSSCLSSPVTADLPLTKSFQICQNATLLRWCPLYLAGSAGNLTGRETIHNAFSPPPPLHPAPPPGEQITEIPNVRRPRCCSIQ